VSDQGGPRTIAARALLTRAPGGRSTMRGVAMAELSRLLARIEDEAAAPYRTELAWALDELAERLGAGDDSLAERIEAARRL
jgi:hypothetical protein